MKSVKNILFIFIFSLALFFSFNIKAYAKEDPEKVKVFRNATFFFPRADKLNQ